MTWHFLARSGEASRQSAYLVLMSWHISIDTGGTFTDCMATDPTGNVRTLKILSDGSLRNTLSRRISPVQWKISTPWEYDPQVLASGWIQNVRTGETSRIQVLSLTEFQLETPWTQSQVGDVISFTTGEPAPVLAARLLTGCPLGKSLPQMDFRLGTTKGTNALLERKGGRTLLITNSGLQDLLLIGDQARPDLFAKAIYKPPPLTDLVIGTTARMAADGQELSPLDPEELARLLILIQKIAPEAIAISLLHAYRFPRHEKALAEAIRSVGYSDVSVSHELVPEIRLLPRTRTTVTNAWLTPVLKQYLEQVTAAISAEACWVMSSTGGLVSSTSFHPKDSLLSGPAGGVAGAAAIARRYGIPQILSFDMGGTSTDVARCEEHPVLQYETRVGAVELLLPSVAVETVAAGGGSVCKYDGRKLSVGPESAGASPGPACYGAGGPLTITDVNLLLGYVDESAFPFPLFAEAAKEKAAEIAQHAQVEVSELLLGFREIADETMAGAVRQMTLRHGQDPTAHHLISFGGAGGQHACSVAELLGISTVLVPGKASILSAWGIHKADLTNRISQSVLMPLNDALPRLDNWIAEMQEKLALADPSANEGEASYRMSVELRYSGQNHSLEFWGLDELVSRFEQEYERRFGHQMPGRVIECVTLRVERMKKVSCHEPVSDAGGWNNLSQNLPIKGPAMLSGQDTTVVVPEGWAADLTSHGDLMIRYLANRKRSRDHRFFGAELELFSQRFQHIAVEMGEMLRRTSLSVNVKERLDYSCALMDAEGFLVANAPHVPVHLGSLGICLREVLAAIDIAPGDVIVTNHPGYGGSHLPDVTVIQGVFEADRCIGYVMNRAHHAEIGGTRPGSTPPFSTRLMEEGVIISPTYLVRNGVFQESQLKEILMRNPFPSRNYEENLGDLRAAVAANQSGASALKTLVGEVGAETVHQFMKAIQEYANLKIEETLSKLSNSSATEYLDDGSRISVSIQKQDGRLVIDFDGSSPVHAANTNATPAIVHSAVLYVLRTLMDEPLPLNEGLLTSVDILLPEGMLSPDFSVADSALPAVVGGNTEVSQRLTDTLLKAFGGMACGQGTMNNLLFGNETFGFYETIGGGSGAIEGADGADAVHQHMTNTRLTDPELLETRYPVRLKCCAIRQGSGGSGRWKGGNGMVREIEFLDSLSVTFLSQHRVESPYGVNGGRHGARGRQEITWPDGTKDDMPGIFGVEVTSGTVLRIETPGGGGFGTELMPDS